jgi:hypothetical protein
MKKLSNIIQGSLWLVLLATMIYACGRTKTTSPPSSPGTGQGLADSTAEISRTIDVLNQTRPFPRLAAYINTSLQKAPAPVLAEIAEKEFGRPEITRCWLNLDEMWDYRTRKFNFDFQIGVDKYKDIKAKHRETWNWEIESPVTFYQYLKAFSDHSNSLLLCIRRYERDILDRKLPVTQKDWKMLFKEGLKHYKMLCPNIRYVEVGNEYHLKGFMGATDEEYYIFYKLGYEAVNEINEELGLTGENKLLVGGPVTTGQFKRLEHFLELYSQDSNPAKKLDFVAWHEYHTELSLTANRQQEITGWLVKYNLPQNLPMFITEHDPFHYSEDKPEYHIQNTAYLPKSLYFTSLYSPEIKIFPWVLYHNATLQTKFMWFDGPNNPDTKETEIHMLPLGASVKFLGMHKGKEIQVENDINGTDLVLASIQNDRVIVEAINYAAPRNVILSVLGIRKAFPDARKMKVVKYLIDSTHSNRLANPDFPGGIEKTGDETVNIGKRPLALSQEMLERNGLVLWELTIEK